MASQQLDDERIFHTARRITDEEARADYLDQICAADQALRERVDALLAVHEQEQEFLKSAKSEPLPTVEQPITEAPGQQIGRYKLLEQIGEGGMGAVFVAEQERPIRRRVALKLIKPGMDSKSVIARFEAERQALAMMDHPHIAKVLDAGTTDSGRPYFAMELVKGIPITDYCDRNRLSIAERLSLFVKVCQAIQHAHQKGIIHRDIKPSNVLVTLHDGNPIPKVIDFGVAKAINARLTDKTVYTEHLQVVGTLLYMSPEQAELSGLDVDTRSDIYSLGVLLYEILTGTTPFLAEDLSKAGFDEQRRIIREKEPQRASIRISSLGQSASTVAEHRKTDPQKLSQLVQGDLDWILLKSLDKDRTRRYDSASAMGQDITRFLDDEDILARPPSTRVRLQKYIRRHRVAVVAISSVAFALLLGLAISSYLAVRLSNLLKEQRELLAAKQALLDDYREKLTEKALLAAFDGDVAKTMDVAKSLADVEDSESQVSMIKGLAYFYSGNAEKADALLGDAMLEDPENVAAVAMLSILKGYEGKFDEAEKLGQQAFAMNPRSEYREYDELFLAYLRMYYAPDESIKRLEELLKKNPSSPIVRAHLAAAIAEKATYTFSEEQSIAELGNLERAWEQIENAKANAPDNFFIDLIEFLVHFAEIELFQTANLEITPSMTRRGDVLKERLLAHPAFPIGLALVAWHAELLQEPDLENVYREVFSNASEGYEFPIACLKFAEFDPDWDRELIGFPHPAEQCTLALLRAAVEKDKWLESTDFHSLVNQYANSRFGIQFILAPLAAGLPEIEIKKLAAEMLSNYRQNDYETGIINKMVETRFIYLAEGKPDKWLLDKAGDNRNARLEAEFLIAMKHHGRGDTESARWRLSAAVKIRAPWCNEYHWARALDRRLAIANQ